MDTKVAILLLMQREDSLLLSLEMQNIPEITLDACTEENMGLLHNNGNVTSVVPDSVHTRTHAHTHQPPQQTQRCKPFPN